MEEYRLDFYSGRPLDDNRHLRDDNAGGLWKNKATQTAVTVLYCDGYVDQLNERAYHERLTLAKVQREVRRAYAERFPVLLPADYAEIDWDQIANDFLQNAREWAEFDR